MARIVAGAVTGAMLLLLCVACDGSTIFKTFDLASGQSLSIDAKQRLVLVSKRTSVEQRPDGTVVTTHSQIVCTEPSPDAIVARAAALAGSITSPTAAAALGAAMSESAASIGLRTPTIQLLRDGLFRACEAYMNGLIDKDDYHIVLFNYDRMMVALLIVDAAAGFKPQPNVAINAGQVGIDTSASTSFQLTRQAPAADGGQSSDLKTTNQAGAKIAGQAGGTPVFATAPGGYDAATAGAAKDVLLRVANLMLSEHPRLGFCITPTAEGALARHNPYLGRICDSMTRAVDAYVESLKARNDILKRCVTNPTLPICKADMG